MVIFIIVTSNYAAQKNIGVEVLKSSKKCSEVKVEVGEKNSTPGKYRYRLSVLKYSSEVVLLSYYTSLDVSHFGWRARGTQTTLEGSGNFLSSFPGPSYV